jgi:hypothetical protein
MWASVVIEKGSGQIMAKQTGNSSGKGSKADQRCTLKLAEYGRDVRRLMWMKLLHGTDAETRKLLIAYTRLDRQVRVFAPDKETEKFDHMTLLDEVNAGERLLTGQTDETWAEVVKAWHT